jgi:ribosomal protein L13E
MAAVKPRVFKKHGKQRYGKGFSREELKKAGLNVRDGLRFKIPVDAKRKTAHEENVQTVKTLLQEKKAAAKPRRAKRKSKS